jgi:hypothetical protein
MESDRVMKVSLYFSEPFWYYLRIRENSISENLTDFLSENPKENKVLALRISHKNSSYL